MMSTSAAGMNWTCLVYGGPMLFVIIWWVVDARKWFRGPKVRLHSHLHMSLKSAFGSPRLHLPF